MNRRGFLRALGAAGVAVVGATHGLLARAAPGFASPPVYAGSDPESLMLAIQRLFPAGCVHSFKAYEEFVPGRQTALPPEPTEDMPIGRLGSAELVSEGSRFDGPVQRVIHQTFALGYRVSGFTVADGKKHRALYRAMYQTFAAIAARPENRGAVLVWRKTPTELRADLAEWGDRPIPAVQLRVRAGLRQTGWRERLEVRAQLQGFKTEGEPAEVLA